MAGYATSLEAFNSKLPGFFDLLTFGNLFVLATDHSSDPTWKRSDHRRENVPILTATKDMKRTVVNFCDMSDVGATIAEHLGLPPLSHGRSFLGQLGLI